MSDFRAIATVTAALSQRIRSAIAVDVPGTTITFGRPDNPGATAPSRVNVYLYQATPNVAFRSLNNPTRRVDGSPMQRAVIALDLHYLVSFYGDESQLRPQLLMASVARTLNAHPNLTAPLIAGTLSSPTFAFLAGSDLARSAESVKFVPATLTLEEMGRIWSIFFQTPYVLSLAYQASVVFLEDTETPVSAPPVLAPSISVRTVRTPRIARVEALDGGPILTTSVLRLTGERLRAPEGQTRLQFLSADAPIVLTPGPEVRDDSLQAPLTGRGLAAGIQGIRVEHAVALSDASPTLYPIFASDVAAFVLHPAVGVPTLAAGTLSVPVVPTVETGQSVQLELVGADDAVGYIARLAPPLAPTATLQFPVAAAHAGAWRVRVRVDSADSPLNGAPTVLLP